MMKVLHYTCDENYVGAIYYEVEGNRFSIWHPLFREWITTWYFQVFTGYILFTSPDGSDQIGVDADSVEEAIQKEWGDWNYKHEAVGGDILAISSLRGLS